MSREKSVTVPDMNTEEFLRHVADKVQNAREVFPRCMPRGMQDFMKDARGKSFEVALEELKDEDSIEAVETRLRPFTGNVAAFIVWALRERPYGHSWTPLPSPARLLNSSIRDDSDEVVETWDAVPSFYRHGNSKPEFECFSVLSEIERLESIVVAFREIKS